MGEDPQVIEIPLDRLEVSKFNVRREIGDISELVDSIKAVGVLQPIIVRPAGKDRYEVIVGSRRFAAAQKAKLKTIPAIVKEMSDDEAIVESLVENIQRGDLGIEEIAEAYNLIHELDPKRWTQEAFAGKISKGPAWLSKIMTAYECFIKLKAAGKRYRMKEHPTRRERKEGVLPYTFLVEVEYALKSEEVRKVIPEEKIDEVRVKLVETIEDLPDEDAKRTIDLLKMYPEKIIEKGIEEGLKELREMALARKTGIELKTYVPASVMRKVEETAEELGKPVEVILPTILERGIEQEARKVEMERLLERAPSYVVDVAHKMESTMTPRVLKRILELPEEKQKDVVSRIETLRLTEEEALDQIEAAKRFEVSIPPEEVEAIKKRYEDLMRRVDEIARRPEVKERGELFRNWYNHYTIYQGLQGAFCPRCGKEKSGRLEWSCCHLSAEEALKLAGEKFEKSQKSS